MVAKSDDLFTEEGRTAYLRRQALVAEFGQSMRSDRSMAAILHDAVEKAADGMQTCCSRVVEYRPETGDGIVRAAHGWRRDIVDSHVIPATADTPFGHSVRTREPLHVADLRADPRFVVSDLLREQGIVSLLNVPIMRAADEPYGTLEVDADEPRSFPPDGVLFLLAFSHLIGAALARRAAEVGEAAAKMAAMVVAERDTMLREMQHRMNNNLTMLAGMLSMEARRSDSEIAREALEKAVSHIQAVAEANRQLDADALRGAVDLGTYLPTLCANLLKPEGVDCSVHSEIDVKVAPERAIPVGLVINEAIINACKYAFTEGKGTIRVTVEAGGRDGWAAVAVTDDGIGLPRDADLAKGSGSDIMNALARQLGGEIVRSSKPGSGTRVELRFPIEA